MTEQKYCASCGRIIDFRQVKNWSDLKYCSKKCRHSKANTLDKQLELEILHQLKTQKCIDIDNAAKALAGENWQRLRERGRKAARRLVQKDEIEFTQQGRVLEPSYAKGAIMLRKKI